MTTPLTADRRCGIDAARDPTTTITQQKCRTFQAAGAGPVVRWKLHQFETLVVFLLRVPAASTRRRNATR